MHKTLLGMLSLAPLLASANVRQRVYVSTGTDEGQESIIAWSFANKVKVSMNQFTGTLSTSSTLQFADAQTIFGNSINKWLAPWQGLTGAISLDLSSSKPYAVANNCEFDASTKDIDNVNNMLFTSKLSSTCATPLENDSGIIGITKAHFSSKSGEIVEADIQFDDTSFKFTSTGSNDITANPKVVNLNDVVTHEFGHFLGLDHSDSRTATMLFAVADDLQTPKDDDMSGIMALYPPTNVGTATGDLQGSVSFSDGTPVFGAMVFLLDARTLKVNSAEFTNNNGAFEFCTTKPGPQVAFATKYVPFGGNVHEYYTGTDGKGPYGAYKSTCFNPGCDFMTDKLATTFFADAPAGTATGGLEMKTFQITAGKTTSYLNISGSQDQATMDDVPGNIGATATSVIPFDSPRVALLSTTNLGLGASGAPVGYDDYQFTVPSGVTSVRVSTAALAIYSRLNLQLAIVKASDLTPVTCTGQSTATVNLATDPYQVCTVVAGTDYIAKVTGTAVSCKDVPGNSKDCENTGIGESASTNRPQYMIAVSDASKVNTTTATATAVTLATTSEAVTTYKNIPTCGTKSKLVSTSGSGGGCCGTLNNMNGRGPKGPQTWLLSLLLNPAFFFALYWWGRRRLAPARR